MEKTSNDTESYKVHYVKSPHFFEAPLHGIFSGHNDDGHFVICPFSERMAIPKELETSIDENGKETYKTVGKNGNIRTIHGALHLDGKELRRLVDTLKVALARFEEYENEQ